MKTSLANIPSSFQSPTRPVADFHRTISFRVVRVQFVKTFNFFLTFVRQREASRLTNIRSCFSKRISSISLLPIVVPHLYICMNSNRYRCVHGERWYTVSGKRHSRSLIQFAARGCLRRQHLLQPVTQVTLLSRGSRRCTSHVRDGLVKSCVCSQSIRVEGSNR